MTITVLPNRIREVWEWSTDVMRTIDGTESRFSLRSRPRVEVTNNYGPLTQSEMRAQFDRLQTISKGAYYAPIWPYASNLTQSASSSATKIYFDVQRVPVAVGSVVMLFHRRSGTYEFVTVSAVNSDNVDLDSGVTNNLTEKWLVVLAMNAILKDDIQRTIQRITGEFDLTFYSWEDPFVQRESPSVTLNTFNGLPILEKDMLADQSASIRYERDIVDFGNVRFQQSQLPWAQYQRDVEFHINRLFGSSDEFDYWRLFFDTVKGAWGSFYLSTKMEDLTISSVGTGTVTFDQEVVEGDDSAFSCVEVELDDGSVSRHVLSNKSGSTFDVSPDIPAGTVQRVSYLLKCRMSDRLSIDHDYSSSIVKFEVFVTDAG